MALISGITELDRVLGGGFLEGTICAIVGPPGSGTDVFAKQFASVGEEKSFYFSTNDSAGEVFGSIKRFGWNTDTTIVDIGDKYHDTVLMRRLEVTKYRQEGLKVKDVHDHEETTYRPFNFLTYLTNEIFKIAPPFRIIVDSLDFFIDNYGVEEVLSTLRTLRAYTKKNRGLLLVTLTKGVFDSRVQNSIDALMDTLIELERERIGKKFENNLIVSNVKNFPERSKIMQYSVGGSGIVLMD